jgi:hypothetical protein
VRFGKAKTPKADEAAACPMARGRARLTLSIQRLSILPLSETDGYFTRVGMGWWMENAWDKMEDELSEYILI